jgi:hypothetical protein
MLDDDVYTKHRKKTQKTGRKTMKSAFKQKDHDWILHNPGN